MMIKLSIIIPVYNVQDHLEKCLYSIFNQNFNKNQYEVIIVNDGSTDSSLEICKFFAEKFSNIILIDQINKGLSGARNAGVKIARGEFVWFVDSDDWITDDSLNEISKVITVSKPDVLVLSSADFIEERNVVRNDLSKAVDKRISNIEYLKSDFFEVGAVVYIINRTFLVKNHFYFYEGIFHEDNELIYRLIYETDTIEYLNKICYVVNLREGSITRSVNPKRSYDLLIVCEVLYNYANTQVLKSDKIIFTNLIAMLFNNAMFNLKDSDKQTKQKFETKINKYPFLIDCLKRSSILKYKLEGYLMSIFKYNRMGIYNIMKKFA